jgi:hypothetical protein
MIFLPDLALMFWGISVRWSIQDAVRSSIIQFPGTEMNIIARRSFVVAGWAGAIALLVGLGFPAPLQAAPIRFSATGSFELPAGAVDLGGEPATMSNDQVVLGTIPVDGNPGSLGDAPFHLKISFDGLPDIDVSGVIPSIGYNPDLPVLDTAVTSTATPDQIGLYPELFQRLIAHPEWMHTMSFRGDRPSMELGLSVHPEDPGVIRPVPEPSSALVVAAAFAGLAWRLRRRSAARREG